MLSRMTAGVVALAGFFLVTAPASAGLLEYVKSPNRITPGN